MIFKDKEILDKLNDIERKLNLLVALFKSDKIKTASQSQKSKCGGKNVQ